MSVTPNISVVILTLNARETIVATIESAKKVSDDIHVVDSGSTDGTVEMARTLGAHVVFHPFEHYGAQRNWAMDTLEIKHAWELHLDADERLSDGLVGEILALQGTLGAGGVEGYYIARLVHFLGAPIRHGGMYPIWHMRLFRHGRGRCENRLYDQHFYVAGKTASLEHPMIDDIRMDLGEWRRRHRRWAAFEAREILFPGKEGVIAPGLGDDPVQRKRAARRLYYFFPPFLRAILLFFYRYVLRAGFLDGLPGLAFFTLQTLYFRLLVDVEILKGRLKGLRPGGVQ